MGELYSISAAKPLAHFFSAIFFWSRSTALGPEIAAGPAAGARRRLSGQEVKTKAPPLATSL
jgi:hypothetical protein